MSAEPINMADRIELRRFVGRELLLWIWLESELFEATLSTKKHGSFGLWPEGRLVLSEGKEATIIKGTSPGMNREAKESLLAGKMPELVALHLSFGDHDCTLTLRGDTLGFAGLSVPKKKREEEEAPIHAAPPPRRKKKANEAEPAELVHEAFFDRMHFARDVEALVDALYADFLAVRLSPVWDDHVMPAMQRWVAGKDVDADRYRAARDKAVRPKR